MRRGFTQTTEHVRKRIAASMITRAANFVPRAPTMCSVDGCTNAALCKSVCDKHYQRLQKHGSTELPKRIFDPVAYLSSRSREDGDCRVWLGVLTYGYGVATAHGRQWPAHALSWVTANGPVPNGKQINHRCHNRACIKPEHLYAGTQLENMRDMREAGRANPPRGQRTNTNKLVESQVREIRASTTPAAACALAYGVSESLVRAIRRRQCWAWLDDKAAA